MARKRPYNLLCPIARALDVLGDRWTLLVLRDLHAGPARFGELERGLGVAPNLLAHRLTELVAADLIARVEDDGVVHYRLTDTGTASDLVLWELSRFGAALPPAEDPVAPGNLRTVVLPLRILLARVPSRPEITVRIMIDAEAVTVQSNREAVVVTYGESVGSPELVVGTSYEPFLAMGEGRMDPATFISEHLTVHEGHTRLPEFLEWFSAALATETPAAR